jgi:LmbE family N-acetylglucosaminyl deacetylase
MRKRAMAITAHPDDIEFMMAGTLLLLKQAGYEMHYLNLANGSCGSDTLPAAAISQLRRAEAQAACRYAGAIFHPSLVDDLEIFYTSELIRKVGAIVREVAPEILLLHSPEDYMEDHQNAGRVAVTAAFSRNMKNYETIPPVAARNFPITLYHAQPYQNRDQLGRMIIPDFFVDISLVIQQKKAMLTCHSSQQSWLDESQGINAYLETMINISRETGKLSKIFEVAEGWRRHHPAGFCDKDADPLGQALKPYLYVPNQ